MKLYVISYCGVISFANDPHKWDWTHPAAAVLGTIEVEEPEKEEKNLVWANIYLNEEGSGYAWIYKTKEDAGRDACTNAQFRCVPIELPPPKKTVTKELEMIGGYFPGEIRFKMPYAISSNIKCTCEVEERPVPNSTRTP